MYRALGTYRHVICGRPVWDGAFETPIELGHGLRQAAEAARKLIPDLATRRDPVGHTVLMVGRYRKYLVFADHIFRFG